MEQGILTRVHAVADPSEAIDPEYSDSLRSAVSAAIDYGLEGVKGGEGRPPDIPVVLLAQARMAARNGISLDTVLRRYFAGYVLMGDCLIEETARETLLGGAALKYLLRTQAAIFDRLIAGVSEEYGQEKKSRLNSSEERRVDQVQRLLDGELLDAADFDYDFEAHHLAVIAAGPGAVEAIRELTAPLDARPLMVRRGESGVWAWFGSRRALDPDKLEGTASDMWAAPVALALGEVAQGIDGWRLTHRQACAALPIAMRSPGSLVRYSEVALLASMLQDEVLMASLRQLYLEPLDDARDSEMLRGTLRAYFAARCNVSSAGAILGVKRHTVTNRLRAIEGLLGRSLGDCSAELDAALRLEELGGPVFRAEPRPWS